MVGGVPPDTGASTLILVFGASRFLDDPAPIVELRRRCPAAVFAGCSSAGEMFGSEIADDSLAVAIARFEATALRLEVEPIGASADSADVDRCLGDKLRGDGLRRVLVLSDGLCVNGTELVRGIASSCGGGVTVTGGLAGDGDRFRRTWVTAGDELPQSGRVAAVGFYGDRVSLGHGSRGGWDTFGPLRRITRSSGNVLYELDGRPALGLYKQYLGDRAIGLATGLLVPLAIRRHADERHELVRTILAVDEAEQSMTFAGDVPQGWHAQLMKANFDRLVDGAALAATLARGTTSCADSILAIAVSCVGRRLVLGERTEEEIEATLECMPVGTQMVGFYSYGEISPSTDGTCELHNQTMTITTLGEEAL
jgi:hypothetical protein